LDVVLQFLPTDVRFMFMENEQVPNGVCIDGRYFGGAGLTMLEWLHVPGFLEVVVRNEAIRLRIVQALRAWR
jgi:hypothetical protein